ncbi:MAG TPA: hypothetical protein VHK47_23980 [Polyangia bacterium]|nr:hypothetical protein [Polyangia bacterium]
MIRSPMIRVLFVVGALAGSQVARAADQPLGPETTAEKEGARLVGVGQNEQLAAKADKARAADLERQAKAMKETADRTRDKGAEGRADLLKQQAKALDKASDLRADNAKQMIDDGQELAKAGAKQREAAAKAMVAPGP